MTQALVTTEKIIKADTRGRLRTTAERRDPFTNVPGSDFFYPGGDAGGSSNCMDANPLDDPGLSDFANYDYSDDPTRDFLDPEYQAAIAEAWRERWDGVDGGISDTSFDIFNIITSIAPIGKAAMAAGGLWSLTRAGSSEVLTHSTFGNFYKSASDGLWWSVAVSG